MGLSHFSCLLWCLTHVLFGSCWCCHLTSMLLQICPLWWLQMATLNTIHVTMFHSNGRFSNGRFYRSEFCTIQVTSGVWPKGQLSFFRWKKAQKRLTQILCVRVSIHSFIAQIVNDPDYAALSEHHAISCLPGNRNGKRGHFLSVIGLCKLTPRFCDFRTPVSAGTKHKSGNS